MSDDMLYKSTRGGEEASSAQAIVQGLADDGGLFAPEVFPQVGLETLAGLDYCAQAEKILGLYLTDFTKEEISGCVRAAYGLKAFPEGPVVLRDVCPGLSVLELWHGPTSAFKDMALQLLPRLLTTAMKKTGEEREVAILVATSGDTGKAALDGFADVKGTRIIVFYPSDGVSDIQKLQMVTQTGGNVSVLAIEGNFDDAQAGVKDIFNDEGLGKKLAGEGFSLSSANSINWGRLVPQIVYYFAAYAEAVARGHIKAGEKVDFAVPTGNFGNILAGYYAKHMGLPVGKFICASNANNVLADFITTGRYDRKRAFHKTLSPSMDILVSSNLERLLYHLTEGDAAQVATWMAQLAQNGCYDIGAENLRRLQEEFYGCWVDDALTQKTIATVFDKYGYLLDTHTAVAWLAAETYRAATGNDAHTIVLSTASPFKFTHAVLAALGVPEEKAGGPFTALAELADISGLKIPLPMQALANMPVLHKDILQPAQMKTAVLEILQKR